MPVHQPGRLVSQSAVISPPLSTADYDFSSRSKTSASVAWVPPPWTDVGAVSGRALFVVEDEYVYDIALRMYVLLRLHGADVTLKWRPLVSDRGWPFVTWQTEFSGRSYEADSFVGCPEDPSCAAQPFLAGETLNDWGTD